MTRADRAQQIVAGHARSRERLLAVAGAILPGTVVNDRALAETLIRVLGAMVHLYEVHASDLRGRCRVCRRHPCPLQALPAI